MELGKYSVWKEGSKEQKQKSGIEGKEENINKCSLKI
jgi:hypothetical protein